jgi:peptidyl-prolyl cis-trans isomerase SurA
MRLSTLLSLLLSILQLTCPKILFSEGADQKQKSEVILNAIVASVNSEPITLRELRSRHSKKDKLSLKQAGKDKEAQQILELLILEKVIEAEAAAQRITASDSEVSAYIDRIAARNNLSSSEFEAALQNENKSIDKFRSEVKTEILRSKLAGLIIKGGVGVKDDEIERYIKDHPELLSPGSKIKLSQILIARNEEQDSQGREVIQAIRTKLDAGEDFFALAQKYSDSPEAEQGGSLGILAEKDLSPFIRDSIAALKDGEISSIAESPLGFHIFKIEERFTVETDSLEQMRTEIKNILKQQKLEAKMHSYFSTEIYKIHAVERKI